MSTTETPLGLDHPTVVPRSPDHSCDGATGQDDDRCGDDGDDRWAELTQ